MNSAGFVVSVSLASAFVGCAVSGTIADVVGRRRAFQISCIPMIFGAIIRFGHAGSEFFAIFPSVCNVRLILCSNERIFVSEND